MLPQFQVRPPYNSGSFMQCFFFVCPLVPTSFHPPPNFLFTRKHTNNQTASNKPTEDKAHCFHNTWCSQIVIGSLIVSSLPLTTQAQSPWLLYMINNGIFMHGRLIHQLMQTRVDNYNYILSTDVHKFNVLLFHPNV